MKLLNKSIRLSVSLAALFFAQSSFADGTEAGTVVSNTATLSYSVGGAAQSDITSDVADFKVDQKVDLTVTGDSASNVIVGPSSSSTTPANKLSYKLSNDGNLEQIFKVAVSHLATDQFDAGTAPSTTAPQAAEACTFTINDGSSTTGPHALSTTPSVTLAIDAVATIEVMCSMPNRPDVDDGHLSTIDVLATAVDTGGVIMKESTIADREDEVDVVLVDGTGEASDTGDRNAMHSDTQTFEINAPMLSVVKASKVISDPYNGSIEDDAGNIPKRIPGATVEYSITITNSSDSPATGVKITDILQAAINSEVEFVASSIVSGSGTSSNYNAATDTITADGITVPAAVGGTGGEAVVTFRVIIL